MGNSGKYLDVTAGGTLKAYRIQEMCDARLDLGKGGSFRLARGKK